MVQALGTHQPDQEVMAIHGHQVAVVDVFVYLGALTHSSVDSSYDIHRRNGFIHSATVQCRTLITASGNQDLHCAPSYSCTTPASYR